MSKTHLLKEILDNLKEAETQQEKLEILNKYKHEKILKRVIKTAYNPWIDLGMQNFVPKHMGKKFGMGITRFLHIIDDLIDKKLDQKEAEFACNMAFIHLDDRDAQIFLDVINQKLNLGLEIETINLAWENLIMKYPIRQATYGDIDSIVEYPVAVQDLSIGLRINILVEDNKVEYKLKDGTSIDWSKWNSQFATLSQNQNIVFDGHAVVVKDGKIVATNNDAILDAHEQDIRFLLWDAVTFAGFRNGEDTKIGYNWRYNGIEHMMLLAMDKVQKPVYDLVKAEMCGNKEQLETTVKGKNCVVKCMSGTWSHGETDKEIIIVS